MKIKKLLSLILAVLLLCTSVPVAFAETTIPASSLSCGDTFTLGRWPQTLVEDEQIIEELNKSAGTVLSLQAGLCARLSCANGAYLAR